MTQILLALLLVVSVLASGERPTPRVARGPDAEVIDLGIEQPADFAAYCKANNLNDALSPEHVRAYLETHPEIVSALVAWTDAQYKQYPLTSINPAEQDHAVILGQIDNEFQIAFPCGTTGWVMRNYMGMTPDKTPIERTAIGVHLTSVDLFVDVGTEWQHGSYWTNLSWDIRKQSEAIIDANVWVKKNTPRYTPLTPDALLRAAPQVALFNKGRRGSLVFCTGRWADSSGGATTKTHYTNGMRIPALANARLTLRGELALAGSTVWKLPNYSETYTTIADLIRKRHEAAVVTTGPGAVADLATVTQVHQWLARQDTLLKTLRGHYAKADKLGSDLAKLRDVDRTVQVILARGEALEDAREANAALERDNLAAGGAGADARNTVVRKEIDAQATLVAAGVANRAALGAKMTVITKEQQRISAEIDPVIAELTAVQVLLAPYGFTRGVPHPSAAMGIESTEQRVMAHTAHEDRVTTERNERVFRGLAPPPGDPAEKGYLQLRTEWTAAYTAAGIPAPESAECMRRITEPGFSAALTEASKRIDPPFQQAMRTYLEAWATSEAGMAVRRQALRVALQNLARGTDTAGRSTALFNEALKKRAEKALETVDAADVEAVITEFFGYRKPIPGEPAMAKPPANPTADDRPAPSSARDPEVELRLAQLRADQRALVPLGGEGMQDYTIVYMPSTGGPKRIRLIGYVDTVIKRLIPADPALAAIALDRSRIVRTDAITTAAMVERVPLALLPDRARCSTYVLNLPAADATGLAQGDNGQYRASGWYDEVTGWLTVRELPKPLKLPKAAIVSVTKPTTLATADLTKPLAEQTAALADIATSVAACTAARTRVEATEQVWLAAFTKAEVADRWLRAWKLDSALKEAEAGRMVTLTYPDGRTTTFALERDNTTVRKAIAAVEADLATHIAALQAARKDLAAALPAFITACDAVNGAMRRLDMAQRTIAKHAPRTLAPWPQIPLTVTVPLLEQVRSNTGMKTQARWSEDGDGRDITPADERAIARTRELLRLNPSRAPPRYNAPAIPNLPAPEAHAPPQAK